MGALQGQTLLVMFLQSLQEVFIRALQLFRAPSFPCVANVGLNATVQDVVLVASGVVIVEGVREIAQVVF